MAASGSTAAHSSSMQAQNSFCSSQAQGATPAGLGALQPRSARPPSCQQSQPAPDRPAVGRQQLHHELDTVWPVSRAPQAAGLSARRPPEAWEPARRAAQAAGSLPQHSLWLKAAAADPAGGREAHKPCALQQLNSPAAAPGAGPQPPLAAAQPMQLLGAAQALPGATSSKGQAEPVQQAPRVAAARAQPHKQLLACSQGGAHDPAAAR